MNREYIWSYCTVKGLEIKSLSSCFACTEQNIFHQWQDEMPPLMSVCGEEDLESKMISLALISFLLDCKNRAQSNYCGGFCSGSLAQERAKNI